MKRIAVMGMGRSGTTFMTQFLSQCGVFVDEVNWAFEHELARLINDSILAQEFGARPGLPYGRLPRSEIELSEGWHRLARCFVEYMDGRARTKGAASPYWVFKDPRTTVLHNVWIEHIDIIVGVFRAPQEVAESYLGQGWIKGLWKRRRVVDYWKRFNQSLLHVYDSHRREKPVYILNYDEDMAVQTSLLCKKLGILRTPEAERLFKPALKHYHSNGAPEGWATAEMYTRLLHVRMANTSSDL